MVIFRKPSFKIQKHGFMDVFYCSNGYFLLMLFIRVETSTCEYHRPFLYVPRFLSWSCVLMHSS